MPWYTTADARRDAARQAALKQQAGLLDKAQTSKPLTRQEPPMNPRQVIYAEVCAMDNQDVPAEDYPDRLMDALARAGYAVVPVALPFEILGEAAMRGVSETGNPKHCWDYLLQRVRVGPAAK